MMELNPPSSPCGRHCSDSSGFLDAGYLLHIEEGSWIKWRKWGGNNIETGRDIYLTVSSTLFSPVLSHSASALGLLQTCTVSYPTVSLKGCARWDSSSTSRVFKDALPPLLLTDSLAKYRQDLDSGWRYWLVLEQFSPPQKAMTY